MQFCRKPEELKIQLAKVSYNPKDNILFLTKEYPYEDEDKKSTIILDKNFRYDLASIPRFLWGIIAIHELSVEATLIHDFMYMSRGGRRKYHKGEEIKGRIDFADKPENYYSRQEADDLFLEVMGKVGVCPVLQCLGYIGVRIFGVIFWRPEWLENLFHKLDNKKVDECQCQ